MSIDHLPKDREIMVNGLSITSQKLACFCSINVYTKALDNLFKFVNGYFAVWDHKKRVYELLSSGLEPKYIIKNEHRKHWVGDGFLVHNLIPGYSQEIGIHSSPFLMFDYESPTYTPPQKTNHLLEQPRKRGVGQHPHKGFETVTIVYSGSVEHKDSGGNGGIIGPGDVQWMTAGRGIIHQEYLETTFSKNLSTDLATV